MAPTPTLPQAVSRLLSRQQQQPTTTVIVDPGNNGGGSTSDSGLSGGAIAGIVIGTVVGILLILWVIRACTQPRGGGGPDASRQGWYDDTTGPRPRSRSRSVDYAGAGGGRHHHHHHHHSARHHGRRRSSTPRPVVIEEKYPRRPSATYVYPPAEGRRSRSRSQGRYYVSG